MKILLLGYIILSEIFIIFAGVGLIKRSIRTWKDETIPKNEKAPARLAVVVGVVIGLQLVLHFPLYVLIAYSIYIW